MGNLKRRRGLKSKSKEKPRPEGIKRQDWYKHLKRVKQEELEAMYRFKELSRVKGARCASCRQKPFELQVHHVIPKQKLKEIKRLDLLWDERNGLVLCDKCHSRHELAFRRVTRQMLRIENIEFALELGLGWMIEKYYPKEAK